VPIVQFVVGFCGRVYLILQLACRRRSDPQPTTASCFALSDVDAFVETYLKDHGHEVPNPALPDIDFDAAVRIAQHLRTGSRDS
jgi:hypothetical protein